MTTENPGPFLVGDRPMPQSIESEKAVLSCLLLDPADTMDLAFSKIQTEEYFHVAAHRTIYSCLTEMRNDMVPGVIDMITLTDRLERSGVLESVGGEDYLNHLLNIVPTTANVERYIGSVINAHMLRSLITACSDIVGQCYDSSGDINDLIDLVERQILNITEMNIDTKTKRIGDLMRDAIDYLNDLSKGKASTTGLPTGFDIDKKITGLKAGELVVLAARPSIGKTALALDIVRNVGLRNNKPVGIFSLEMGSHQIVLRLLCSEAQINLKDVRDGKLSNAQWANDIMGAGDRLRGAPVYIDDTPQLTSLELRQKSRRMKLDHDVQLIVIDYLQLMKSAGMNKQASREQEVARLSADIKSLAKELNIPILLLCQLNRQAEQGENPKLSQLRESGAIEQDADIVMLLHRARVTEADQDYDEEDGIESKLIIAKNRNGETGIVNLTFKPQWACFFNQSYISDSDVAANASY